MLGSIAEHGLELLGCSVVNARAQQHDAHVEAGGRILRIQLAGAHEVAKRHGIVAALEGYERGSAIRGSALVARLECLVRDQLGGVELAELEVSERELESAKDRSSA